MKISRTMVKVIIRKINLDNFRFEMLDNSLIEELKHCVETEHRQDQLPLYKEPANNQAPGHNHCLPAEVSLR